MLLLDGKLRSRTGDFEISEAVCAATTATAATAAAWAWAESGSGGCTGCGRGRKKGRWGEGEREGSGCGGYSCFSDSWASCEGKVQAGAGGDQSSGKTSEAHCQTRRETSCTIEETGPQTEAKGKGEEQEAVRFSGSVPRPAVS